MGGRNILIMGKHFLYANIIYISIGDKMYLHIVILGALPEGRGGPVPPSVVSGCQADS